jgi:hypothetical protein
MNPPIAIIQILHVFGISDRNESRDRDAYALGNKIEASWELKEQKAK